MASQQSTGNLIADRYASALYELSSEKKCVDDVLSDLQILKKYINQNKDFKLLIRSPLIASSAKLLIVEKLLLAHSTNTLTLTFLKVISNNKRFASLPSIISRFVSINFEKRGEVLADITSADELSDKEKNGIKNKLRSILGEKLLLNYKVDNKILGGLIVKIGSKMIDSSLASKINKLKVAIEGAQWK